jgi:hypothetical protein
MTCYIEDDDMDSITDFTDFSDDDEWIFWGCECKFFKG